MKTKQKIFLLLSTALLCLFAVTISKAQLVCDSSFIKEYTINGQLQPFATASLPGNETLVAGRVSQNPPGVFHAMAVKFSSAGTILWSISLGGNGEDGFTGITLLNDGSYLLFGTTRSFGYTGEKTLLVRLASNGTVLWSRQLGTGSPSNDRIKALIQYSDGDIIGSFNANDSTAQSDPVVFKMGLNGTLKWSRRFDNNGEESFTSLAFDNSVIYASGYFTAGKKRGVISKLNSTDGSVISSDNIYFSFSSNNQAVINLEIKQGLISYGLEVTEQIGNAYLHKIGLVQADMTGHKTFETLAYDDFDTVGIYCRQMPGGGFYILRNRDISEIIKLNRYNLISWSAVQNNSSNPVKQRNHGLDITASGGTISAGFIPDFFNPAINKMLLVNTTASGVTGSCTKAGATFSTDTTIIRQQPFAWLSASSTVPAIDEPVILTALNLSINTTPVCDTSICTDITPLPPPCKKTYLVEYGGLEKTILRDAVTTNDGGKIAVGEMGYNGWIVKIRNNGDIDSSSKVEEFDKETSYRRIIRSGDNFFAFGNHGYVIDHYAYNSVNIVKLDSNGRVLFSKDLSRNYTAEMADVCALPDGGFVIVLNESYGSGYLNSDLLRFDANLNVVWKKEIKHAGLTPIYRSVFCTADAVYIGHDTYDSYNYDKIGIQKLDLATGNDIWSKRLAVAGNHLLFKNIIVDADTVYAFFDRLRPTDNYFIASMVRLTGNGSYIFGVDIQAGLTVFTNPYYYTDQVRPTVTFTPEKDFVTCNMLVFGASSSLNISRFNKYGTAIWSKNYTFLSSNILYNIHPQGKGFFIVGTVTRPQLTNPYFTKSFILKTDSNGILNNDVYANCMAAGDYPNMTFPVILTETSSNIDSVINLSNLTITDGNVHDFPEPVDATLFCSVPANCNPALVAGSGNACSLQDTLVYYLSNNNCGAVATWIYDTAYFNMVSMSGDTLKLRPKKSGASMITVKTESSCDYHTQNITTSVLVAASLLNLGPDSSICAGNSIRLKAGPGYQSYQWNDLSTDSMLTVTQPGMYFVHVTDFCGGSKSDTVIISAVNTVFDLTGDSVKCNKDSAMLMASTGFNNYQWSPAANGIFNGNTAKVCSAQSTMYYVNAEKFPGCTVKDSLLVVVKNSPPVNLGNDTSICYNATVTITAPQGFNTYQWSNGAQTAAIVVTNQGLYFVNASYPNGCISSDSIDIKKYPFVKPFLGNDTSVCSGSNFVLRPGSYAGYLWNTAATGSSIPVVNAGQYWVKVTDLHGCTASDSINILDIYPNPANFLKDSTAICDGDLVTLSPLGTFSKYLWSTGDISPAIQVSHTGNYQLTVTDNLGCSGKDTARVVYKPDCATGVFFYNAFTPNNDGINDRYNPVVKGTLLKYILTVYNRYGQVVFTSSNPATGWNGRFREQLQPAGNYVYTCTYQFAGLPEVMAKGYFLMIR